MQEELVLKQVDVQEILVWKQELNLFIFQEFDDQPTKKSWFYLNVFNLMNKIKCYCSLPNRELIYTFQLFCIAIN